MHFQSLIITQFKFCYHATLRQYQRAHVALQTILPIHGAWAYTYITL